MPPFGPQYCETPDTILGIFPVEPANAYSSMIICVWGLIAVWLVQRRAPWAWWLFLACALLITNGVGSTLWHGLRTQWSLLLDWLPAVIFVMVIAFLWARLVAPLWQAIGLIVFLLAPVVIVRTIIAVAPELLSQVAQLRIPGGPFGFIALFIVMGVAWLYFRTRPHDRTAANVGVFAVVFALVALTFRSGDAWACEHLGFGSHFLWHISLSTAAFLAIWTVVRLEPKRVTA